MIPEHFGRTHTRKWYKVKWIRKPSEEGKWKGIEGKVDLIMDEDIGRFTDFIEVLNTVSVEKCESWPIAGFGNADESSIDEWIAKNKR